MTSACVRTVTAKATVFSIIVFILSLICIVLLFMLYNYITFVLF